MPVNPPAPAPVAVIVDAYSAGMHLAPEFIRRSWRCVHVQSTSEVPEVSVSSFVPANFIKNIIFSGDVRRVADELAHFSVGCVLTGGETGVLLTDQLNKALGLPWNDPATSLRRRNKYEMIDALHRVGLPAARQFRSADLDAVKGWLRREMHGEWPVVVKPLDSAGTDGVTFCYSEEDVECCFRRLLGRRNRLGLKIEELLVQSFLEGKEYVVNTVSWEGRHHVTEMWALDKIAVKGASLIYDKDELLPRFGGIQDQLVPYVMRALDAIGLRFGPAHTEVMMTPQGPYLVESGARVQGSIDPLAIVAGLGTNQLLKLVGFFTEPASRETLFRQEYERRKHVMWVQLISRRHGRIVDIPLEEQLRSLESFFSVQLYISRGQLLSPTVDLFTSPGQIFLAHEDPDVIHRDYRTIRDLEGSGFIIEHEASMGESPDNCSQAAD